MGMLEREMKNLARQAGGSHKTVHDRIAMAGRFCEPPDGTERSDTLCPPFKGEAY